MHEQPKNTQDTLTQETLLVKDAIKILREKLGTASHQTLKQSLVGLRSTPGLSEEVIRDLQGGKLTQRVLDAIIAMRPSLRPEGFLGIDEFCTAVGCSPDEAKINGLLDRFMKLYGDSNVLKSFDVWRAGGHRFPEIGVFARSPKNGYETFFFAPESVKLFKEFIKEHRKKQKLPTQPPLQNEGVPLQELTGAIYSPSNPSKKLPATFVAERPEASPNQPDRSPLINRCSRLLNEDNRLKNLHSDERKRVAEILARLNKQEAIDPSTGRLLAQHIAKIESRIKA